MNKLYCFILMSFILIVSCKKDVEYDPEAGMEKGNAILFKKCEVINTFSTYLTARAEFIVFEGLESIYENESYVFSGNDLFGTQTEVLSSSISQNIDVKPYNNLILINTDNRIWLESFVPGYYLERYFRMIDSTSSSTSIVSYGNEGNNLPVFYKENSGLFSNSASFNSSSFYDITRTDNFHNSNVEEDNLISLHATVFVLSQMVDSLSQYSDPEHRQAITLFINGEFKDTTAADILISEFADKALSNDIPVHIITNNTTEYDLQIAQLTGGFFYTGLGCLTPQDGYVPCYDQRVKGPGVILQNLHDIHTMEYKKHICEFRVSKTDNVAFTNAQLLYGGVSFKEFIYPFVLRK